MKIYVYYYDIKQYLPINKIYISMLNNKYKIHNNYLIFFLFIFIKIEYSNNN